MKVDLHWLGNVAFRVDSDSGHQLIMDGPPDYGGDNQGPRAMEMLLAAAAACSATDVVTILKKGGQTVDSLTIAVEGQRADSAPKVFTHIHLHFTLTGHPLDAVRVERAIALSTTKYCSVISMFSDRCRVDCTHTITST